MPEIKAFRNMASNYAVEAAADLGDIKIEFSDRSSSKKEGGESEILNSCDINTFETIIHNDS
jgi:hypothetical protein